MRFLKLGYSFFRYINEKKGINKIKRIHKYWEIIFFKNKQRVVGKVVTLYSVHYIVSRAVKNAK